MITNWRKFCNFSIIIKLFIKTLNIFHIKIGCVHIFVYMNHKWNDHIHCAFTCWWYCHFFYFWTLIGGKLLVISRNNWKKTKKTHTRSRKLYICDLQCIVALMAIQTINLCLQTSSCVEHYSIKQQKRKSKTSISTKNHHKWAWICRLPVYCDLLSFINGIDTLCMCVFIIIFNNILLCVEQEQQRSIT